MKINSKKNKTDLITGIPTQYYELLIQKKLLVKLDSYIYGENGIELNKIYAPALDISKKVGNGHFYFLSPTFSTKLLTVNKDILDELNVPTPSEKGISWEAFRSLAEKIYLSNNIVKQSEIYPVSFGPGGKEGLFMDFQLLTIPHELPIQENNEIYNQKIWFENFTYFVSTFKEYGVKDLIEERAFYTGKVPLRVTYPHELNWLYNKKLGQSILGFPIKDFNFEVYPVPYFKDQSDMANIEVHNIALNKQSTKKDLGWEIISYAMSKDHAQDVIYNGVKIFGGNFVTYLDEDIIKNYEQIYPGIDVRTAFYFGTKGPFVKESMTEKEYYLFHEIEREYFPLILDGKISLEEGFEEIKKQYKIRRKELDQ